MTKYCVFYARSNNFHTPTEPCPGVLRFKRESFRKGIPMSDLEYVASIVPTDNPDKPFDVVVTSNEDGEIGRKHLRTEAEAQLFLQLLRATLEVAALKDEGRMLH